MNFRSLTKTYNRLSARNKVVTGVAAIAGIGALIGIPVLTLNPLRPPSVLNEDALYQSRVSSQSSSGANNNNAKAFDSATPAEIPIDSSIPGIASDSGAKTFDTSDTAGNIDDNSPSLYDAAGNARSNNPYSRSSSRSLGASRYTPSGSLSANPYNASSPNSSILSTPYSLPVPKPATPYSLEPGKGNVYPELNTKPSPNNSVSGVGASPSIPSRGAIAPNTLNGTSGE